MSRADRALIERVGKALFADQWVTPTAAALGVSRKALYQWMNAPPADLAGRLLAAVKSERERVRAHARTVDALVEQLEALQ
jgi:hypothetical protein